MIKVNYLGLIRSPVSWAKIGRELCFELENICDLSIVEQKGMLFDPDFSITNKIKNSIYKKRNTDLEISFIYPPLYKRILGDIKIGGLVYETTLLPQKWVDNINSNLDYLWLPNNFNKKIALDSGVTVPIIIAPYGINRKIFFMSKDHKKLKDSFDFLCIAMPQKRKALKELIKAFYIAFPDKNEVNLTIKMPYLKKKFPFEYSKDEIFENIKDHRVRIVIESSSDEEIRMFLWNSDCYIQPSMSEGFGMVLLEAIACGLPVISTTFGGPSEFLNTNNSFIIEHEVINAKEIQYDNHSVHAKIGRPILDSIVKNMRTAYEDRKMLKRKSENAMKILKDYSWKITADKLLSHIQNPISHI